MTDLSKLSESDAVSFEVVAEIRGQAEGCWEPTIRGATEIAKAVLVAAVRAGDLVEKDQCRSIAEVRKSALKEAAKYIDDVSIRTREDAVAAILALSRDEAHHEASIRASLEPDPETERLLKEHAEYRLKYGPLKGGA